MKTKNVLQGRTFSTAVVLTADENGKLPTQIKVMPVGDWNTSTSDFMRMQITTNHISQMVANFRANVRKLVPIDVDHDGGKAAGWITDLKDMGVDGLHAVVEWTKLGEELLKDKIYRLFSPEWSFDYADPEHGSAHGAVLIAGSLTNRPFFKELPVLVAADGTAKTGSDLTNDKTIMILLAEDKKTNMNVTDILAKAKADRTPEEVAFLDANKTEFTEEQTAQLEAENKPETPETPETPEVPVTPATPEPNKADDKGNITITADELKRYKALEANEKKLATEKEITDKFMAKDNMKITPAVKDLVVDFVLKASEETKASFYKILETLPKVVELGQNGESNRNPLTAKEQVVKLIEEYKANDKLTESQAQAKVEKEHKDLWLQSKEEK